jgi:hypothetical protein
MIARARSGGGGFGAAPGGERPRVLPGSPRGPGTGRPAVTLYAD